MVFEDSFLNAGDQFEGDLSVDTRVKVNGFHRHHHVMLLKTGGYAIDKRIRGSHGA